MSFAALAKLWAWQEITSPETMPQRRNFFAQALGTSPWHYSKRFLNRKTIGSQEFGEGCQSGEDFRIKVRIYFQVFDTLYDDIKKTNKSSLFIYYFGCSCRSVLNRKSECRLLGHYR